jgi:rod shape-determining protein MreD
VKLGRVALFLIGAVALQFLIGASPHRGAWPIDVFLLATAVVARGGNYARAVLVGGALGLVEDVLSHDLLGMNAFAKAALGYALAVLSVRVIFQGPWAVGAAVAVASLVNDLIVAILAALLLQAPIVLFSGDAIWRAVATGATGGALEAAALFPWRQWWEKRKLRRLR